VKQQNTLVYEEQEETLLNAKARQSFAARRQDIDIFFNHNLSRETIILC
jgi:hypothetical protein